MASGVATVWMPVDDMSRAVKFYAETLGLSVKNEGDDWSELDANGVMIGLNAREATHGPGSGGAMLTLQPDGDLFDEVVRLSDAGVEFARRARNADALAQLNVAFDLYMEHEAVADARRVGRALRGLGAERRIVSQSRAKTGWGSLTDSELTVVNLIARGATNRDVATQLHLSLHTVKTHVHNAFAKLGINSRAQLAQLMRGSE